MADYGGDPIVIAAAPRADPYGDPIIKAANPKASAWRARNPTEPDSNNPYLPGFGVPSLSHLWRDVMDRRRQAGEGLDAALGAAAADLNPFHAPASAEEAQRRAQSSAPGAFGLPTALQNVAGAALGLVPGVPEIAAAADTFVGRPVEAGSVALNEATGGATPVVPAQWTGNLVSAAAPIGGQAAAEAGLARAAAEAGMSVEGYQAMIAQQQAAAKAAAAAAKPRGPVTRAVEPFVAAISPQAAEAQAGRKLAEGASDPAAVRASLAGGPDEIVPGSQPTTFQQTGDIGIGSMERQARTADPAAYQERAAEQNAARRDAMPNPGGDPSDVAAAIRQHMEQIDAETQAKIDAAAHRATQQAEAMGGTGTPEVSGSNLREAVTSAESNVRAAEGRLWNAIDPEGTLAGNVTATRQAAQDIVKNEPPTAQPMGSQEAAVFDAAGNLPDVAPVRNLTALRSWVSTTMREELLRNGRSPSYARLSRLRGAIQDNLANTVGEAVQTPEQVSKFEADLAAIADQRTEARAATGGGAGEVSIGRASPASGPAGAEVPAGGRSSVAPGGPGVPSGQPNIDPGYADRLTAATEATKERARTFGVQPVSNITATTGQQGQFRLPDGQVPGRVFKPGPGGFEAMQAAIKAGGDRALQIIEDFAAQSLRRAAQRSDGSIDADAFTKWTKTHQDALRALPEATRARFADAASAGRAVDEAAASRATALKEANAGTLGKILGAEDPADITRMVGAIFGKADAVTQMKALVAKARGNPAALAGLRQAVADHITQNFVGNTEAAASGVTQIKADAFQSFVRKNSGALRLVFTPEEMTNLHAIAADINRAKRSENALKLPGGSNTAQDYLPHATKAEAEAKANVGKSMLDMVGALLGAGLGLHGGPAGIGAGGALGGYATHSLQTLVEALKVRGIARVDALVNRALLDPALARALLAKAPVHRAGTTALDTGWVVRSKAIQRAIVAGSLATDSSDQR